MYNESNDHRRPDALDPGVRGRFSKEIGLPVPDAPSRTKILQLMTVATRLDNDVDLTALGKLTPGFVGADLQALVREAGMIAVTRIVKAGNEFLHGATVRILVHVLLQCILHANYYLYFYSIRHHYRRVRFLGRTT